jgi:hypothetical protein
MPMTPWSEVVGKMCSMCDGPATHIYGNIYICCDCHTGEIGGGLVDREMAEKIHRGEDPLDLVMSRPVLRDEDMKMLKDDLENLF